MGRKRVEEVESKLCLFGCQQKDLGKFQQPLDDNSAKIGKNQEKSMNRIKLINHLPLILETSFEYFPADISEKICKKFSENH